MNTVCVDFDGVLHSYVSGWTGPEPEDDPFPGAVAFVQLLLARGYRVVVFTTRAATPEGFAGTKAWLEKWQFPELPVTAEKVPAIGYVDDRAVVCRPVDGAGFAEAVLAVDALAGNR